MPAATAITPNLAATDNHAAGALAAEHLAEAIGGEGKIGVVGHSQISLTGVDRRDGFVDHMEENHPGIEIVDIQYGDGDHLKSADIAKAMIGAHDLVALYGTDGSAIGIVNAVEELGMSGEDLVIVGFDSGTAQQEAIRSGLMLGSVTQDPIAIGRLTVEAAIAAVNGEELEEFTDTGSYWFDADTIDDEDIQRRSTTDPYVHTRRRRQGALPAGRRPSHGAGQPRGSIARRSPSTRYCCTWYGQPSPVFHCEHSRCRSSRVEPGST